jgi:hypothetical protein
MEKPRPGTSASWILPARIKTIANIRKSPSR